MREVKSEVKEGTGFDVCIDRIAGICSAPGQVFPDDDGEVRQEFSGCLACTIHHGSLRISSEPWFLRTGRYFRPSAA